MVLIDPQRLWSNVEFEIIFSFLLLSFLFLHSEPTNGEESEAQPLPQKRSRKKHDAFEYDNHTWHVNKMLNGGETIYYDCAQ